MPLPANVVSLPGAQELFDWFGYWPSFHDAEVLRANFQAGAASTLVVHTWEITDKVNAGSFFELTKNVVVAFTLSNVTKLELEFLWEHSILFDLAVSKVDTGVRLELSSSYGLSGTLEAREVSMLVIPGQPGPKTLERSPRFDRLRPSGAKARAACGL